MVKTCHKFMKLKEYSYSFDLKIFNNEFSNLKTFFLSHIKNVIFFIKFFLVQNILLNISDSQLF